LYQIYFLDRVPARSAVDESVDLVKRARKTSAKGFANAVLRRAASEEIELKFSDDLDHLSVKTSHPRWILDRWIEQFGAPQAAALAAANNAAGRQAFRVIDEIEVEGIPRSEFVEGCYLAEKLDRRLIELAERGDIYFQDEGSQMAAAAAIVPNGGSFLDVCAAPGGKTGLIARRYAHDLGFAAAGDLHWPRVLTLRENLRKQGANDVQIVQYDAETSLPFAGSWFDAVLVDAPCSGTGTIRHNPEIRYFLKPSDIPELAKKQLGILKNASKLVKSGGSLVYSTCSLEREENEDVVRDFLTENADFEAIPTKVPDRFITGQGYARTFPHRDGMDGFFVAEFRRK
jgi:16S rRNA (cytosine967-C5)-methyltransferase